jgi:hypothetical protein
MKKLIIGSSMCLLLAGCSGGTAECNDSSIKESVISIINFNVQKTKWGQELYDNAVISEISISNVKTTSYNEKIDQYMCESQFNFEYKEEPQSVDISYELSYLEDQNDTEIGVYGVRDVKTEMIALNMLSR